MAHILGLSAFFHDASAALLCDGEIVAAAQQERFSRVKNDARFPADAIAFCLAKAGTSLSDLDAIVFYEKPFLKFERLLDTYLATAPRGRAGFVRAMPIWIKEKLFLRSALEAAFRSMDPGFDAAARLRFSDHHLSHAASAYYTSPFDDAVVLSVDGVGERATTSVAVGQGSDLRVVREQHFPHSLGLLYSAFTQYLGFRVNSDEYKVMGLAPYGTPRFAEIIRDNVIDLAPDGSFWLDQRYFDYCTGLTMTNARFHRLFGQPPRASDAPIETFHMDVAASVQAVCGDVVLLMARALRGEFAPPHLCLAGGGAQNSVINGKLAASGMFDAVYVPPAPGDAGASLGAALAYWHLGMAQPRQRQAARDPLKSGRLGPAFSQAAIEDRLTAQGASFEVLPDDQLLPLVADWLDQGCVVGWFDGAMEFGPRALGARSILADPRAPGMQARVNRAIKDREGFRPFAPAVLADHAADWFDMPGISPYMSFVSPVAAPHIHPVSEAAQALQGFDQLGIVRSDIPSVTHVDGTARFQTVHPTQTPRFHALIAAFAARTGCPMVLNTSFNGRDEPIVCTPEEAIACYRRTEMDVLVCGQSVLTKN